MSRMDRYKGEGNSNLRSRKNQDLYKNIYESGEYSNIEGIATIDKSNEVDITKVKKMLKNREDYQKQKELIDINKKEKEIPKYEVFELEDEEKVYDIRDILTKAKVNKPTSEYQSLNNINFEILKELKEKHQKENEKNSIHEMLDEIANTSKYNKLTDSELGLDMFSDLQSNTVVQDKESIKKVLNEVKKNELEKGNTNTNIDKSFFTSSLNFGKEDFDELNDLKKSVKKNNNLVKVLIYILLLVVTGIIVYLVFNFMK